MESPNRKEMRSPRPKKRRNCCNESYCSDEGRPSVSPVKSPKRSKRYDISPTYFINRATAEAQRSGRVPSYVGNYKLSCKERVLVLHNLRNVGVWILCCNPECSKWRYIEEIKDPLLVPSLWYCHMNPDTNFNDCSKPEQVVSEDVEEDFIENDYTAGSLVWAKFGKYPYWPAIVEDDPDGRQFYLLHPTNNKKVTFYHVSFFDPNCKNRAWVSPEFLRPFTKEDADLQQDYKGNYCKRIEKGKEMALQALELDVVERLRTYSLINRQNMKQVHKGSRGKRRVTHKKKKDELSFLAKDFYEESVDADVDFADVGSQKSGIINDEGDSDFESCFSHINNDNDQDTAVEDIETPSVYSQCQGSPDNPDNASGLLRSFSTRLMNLSRSLFGSLRRPF